MQLAPSRTTALVAAVLAIAALIVVVAGVGDARSQSTSCPSFHVLHNDRIGTVSLPGGYYAMTTRGMTCDAASERFTAFLEDWDGRLPRPWRASASGAGRATFTGGPDSFSVRRTGSTPGGNPSGGGSTRGLTCPTPFRLIGNDSIGSLQLRRGLYRIVRLSTYSPNCSQASSLFTQFLTDFDGQLQGGWILVPDEAAFIRGSLYRGFRVEPWAGPRPPKPPTPGPSRCPSTFRVEHDDSIGPLAFPAGPYRLGILKGSRGLTCAGISDLFRQFLDDPNGVLPSPWVIDANTGTFRQGAGSRTGFSAKPAFVVR
jgi:hypothetical protein